MYYVLYFHNKVAREKKNVTKKINEFESIELRWTNLETVIQSEVNQKEKNIVY